jgi:hypothetical protein
MTVTEYIGCLELPSLHYDRELLSKGLNRIGFFLLSYLKTEADPSSEIYNTKGKMVKLNL